MKKHIFLCLLCLALPLKGVADVPCCGPTKENALQYVYGSEALRAYYDMFQCSCCGKPIDTNCCGTARQRKAYLDQLLLTGMRDQNTMAQHMVQQFGYGILMDQEKVPEVKEYLRSQAPENPPAIMLNRTDYDFGTISQADGRVSTKFTIVNVGESDLIIKDVSTSCGCTTAKLVYQGQESPEFTMAGHGVKPEDYQLSIPPGETAELQVTYDPMAHGAQTEPEQKIVRTVSIVSNDPVDFQKDVWIELLQTP